jgi:hypothetical protein
MVTVLEFVSMLLQSVLDLVVTFVTEVFLGVDPLTSISFLVGGALTTVSVAVFGYLVVGAAVNALTGGGVSGAPARAQPPRE